MLTRMQPIIALGVILVIPTIERILKIFEPKRLPKAKSVSPFLAAIIEVNNSGKLVPMAKTVSPIIL